MSKKEYQNIYGAIFFLIISGVFGYMGMNTPVGLASGIGANFLPIFTSVLIALLSVALLINTFIAVKETRRGETDCERKKVLKTKMNEKTFYNITLTFVYIFMFIFLLKKVGFLIMTPIYLFLQIITIAPRQKRNAAKFAIIAIITTVIIYCMFNYGFKIMLPTGLLG